MKVKRMIYRKNFKDSVDTYSYDKYDSLSKCCRNPGIGA